MSTALVSQSERPPASAGTGARKLTERAFRIRESGIIVVLVVFVAVTASVQPRFLNTTNIQFILVNTTVFALLALGETMVVISRPSRMTRIRSLIRSTSGSSEEIISTPTPSRASWTSR